MLEITLSLRVFEINDIFNFRQNSRWQPKSRSQDKCVFAFYAEIQDDCQKWRESDFCEKSPVHPTDNLQVRNFVEITLSRMVSQINVFCVLCRKSRWPPKNGGKVIFLQNVTSTLCRYPVGPKFCRNCSISLHVQDKCAFALYAEIQDGCQKWRESDFCEKSPVDSSYTLLVKNFVEIALSCTFSEINALLHFMQKFKMAAKCGGKVIFVKSHQYTLDTLGVENFDEIPLSRTVKEIANLCFSIFGENSKWASFSRRGKSFENWQE